MRHRHQHKGHIIMDRYQATKIHKHKRCYMTTMIPTIPEQESDLYIIAREDILLEK